MKGRCSAADRLERLPVTRYHKFVIAIIYVSWITASMNMTGTNYNLPLVSRYFDFDTIQSSYLSSAGFLGMMFGSLVAGYLADRIGRKRVTYLFMLLWMIGGVGSGMAVNIPMVLCCRCISGFGLGAMTPVLSSYISEIIPSKLRGKYITGYMMWGGAGTIAACLITMLSANNIGWRGIYVIEAATGIVFLLIIKFVPESARWYESRGKYEEADKIVEFWERKAEKELNGQPLPLVQTLSHEPQTAGSDRLLSRKYVKILIMGFLWYFTLMAFDFGLSSWLTTLLMSKGFDVISSTGFAAIGVLGTIPAMFATTWLANRVGRKWTIMLGSVLAAATAYIYGLSGTVAALIVTGLLFQFGRGVLTQASVVYLPELFDTSVRSTGSGLIMAIGRVGSTCGPILLAMAMSYGMNTAFYVAAAVALFSGLVVMLFGPETKNKIMK